MTPPGTHDIERFILCMTFHSTVNKEYLTNRSVCSMPGGGKPPPYSI